MIAPGRFDHDPPEVRVAGFGDAAFSNALATGVFARKYATVPHQLPCALEAGSDITQLNRNRDRRDMRHSAQSLEAADYFLHCCRCHLHHFKDRLFQPLDSFSHMVHFVQAIQKGGFLCRLRVMNLLDPLQKRSVQAFAPSGARRPVRRRNLVSRCRARN